MEMIQCPIVVYIVNIDLIRIQFRTDSPLGPDAPKRTAHPGPVTPPGSAQALQQRRPYADHSLTKSLQPHAVQNRGIDDHRAVEPPEQLLHSRDHGRMHDRFQHPQIAFLCENDPPQRMAIDRSIHREDPRAEMPPQFGFHPILRQRAVAEPIHVDFPES